MNAPEIADAGVRPLERELRDLEAAHPGAGHARQPDPARGRAAVRGVPDLRPPRAHAQPRQHLQRGRAARVRGSASSGRSASGRMDYVAELKIDGLSMALHYEKRPPRARRDARRRRARRRRDAERARHQGRAAGPAGRGRARRSWRCAARCSSRARASRRINREREERGEEPFANPRNAAAGTHEDARPAGASRRAASTSTSTRSPTSQGARLTGAVGGARAAARPGACAPTRPRACCHGLDEVLAYCAEWQEKRDALEYEIDGVVVKVDDRSRCSRSWASPSKFPRWAIAYKYPARQATTRRARRSRSTWAAPAS